MRLSVAFAALLLFPLGTRAQDHTLPPDPSVSPLPPVTGKGAQTAAAGGLPPDTRTYPDLREAVKSIAQ